MLTEKLESMITVALADDHILLRHAVANMINRFPQCQVIIEAANGKELLTKLEKNNLPQVVLLDLNMPVMDGFDTADWLYRNHPSIAVLMLSMYESDQALIRLLQTGVRGFLKKDIAPDELEHAIRSVVQVGYYYSQHVSGKMANLFRHKNGQVMALEKATLSMQEFTFLKLAAGELTYKEIAAEMHLNPRAIDGLRDQLFMKLDIRSRVGLAMYAIRQGIVAL